MIRRLLILVFTLSVCGNSVAAASLVGEDECGACCLSARNSKGPSLPKDGMSFSKTCCYSECGEPQETQPAAPTSVPAIERNSKADAPIAVCLVARVEIPYQTGLQSSARSIIESTHLYLRTGTLLI